MSVSVCVCVLVREFPVLSLGGVFPAAQINGLILDINPSIGKQAGPMRKGPRSHQQILAHEKAEVSELSKHFKQ